MKDVERETAGIAGETKMAQPFWKSVGQCLKK